MLKARAKQARAFFVCSEQFNSKENIMSKGKKGFHVKGTSEKHEGKHKGRKGRGRKHGHKK